MPHNKNILKIAKSVIAIERDAISQLENSLTNIFTDVVKLILKSNGRLIVTGLGKSANIANKMVATFNSTGQPSIFLHAVDALHGDLGNIQKNDIIICVSKSGNTEEIKMLVSFIKNLGNKIIALCGNYKSYLVKESDFFLDCTVEKEACPHNLAPTSSTTAQLVMGDALAVCLLELRDFSYSDFALNHPGGSLGKRLYLKVSDIINLNGRAIVSPNSSISKVIIEISNKRLGATAVVDNNEVIGIITDGDLRRMLQKNQDISSLRAVEIMSKNPRIIDSSVLASQALFIMEKHNISQLLVESSGVYLGIIHIHDILKEGI